MSPLPSSQGPLRDSAAPAGSVEGTPPRTVTVHYWASARAAAGVASEQLEVDGPVALSELEARIRAARPGRLGEVLSVCSVLVGDRPVGTADRSTVLVAPGECVEFLPPFAGG